MQAATPDDALCLWMPGLQVVLEIDAAEDNCLAIALEVLGTLSHRTPVTRSPTRARGCA